MDPIVRLKALLHSFEAYFNWSMNLAEATSDLACCILWFQEQRMAALYSFSCSLPRAFIYGTHGI
jgi:hypothetical protein